MKRTCQSIIILALCVLFVPLALAACTQTAAEGVTDPTLRPAAQRTQYYQQAAATEDAHRATVEALALSIQQTADVATLDAMQRDVTATAIATRAEATAAAVATLDRATADARETERAYAPTQTEQARRDATATISVQQTREAGTAIAQIHGDATNTQAAAGQATATASVIQTQTAITLTTEAAEAQRKQVENAAITALIVIAVCVVIYLILHFGRVHARNANRAGALQTYGLHKNPLVIAENGKALTIIDPLKSTSPYTTLDGDGQVRASELTELLRHSAILGALAVLYEQAKHSPFPPVAPLPDRETRHARQIGPVRWEDVTRTGATLAAGAKARIVPPVESLPPAELLLPPEAPWRLLDDWRGGALPLGLGAGGLLLADPEQHPHWLIAGATGSGKSRYALKPLIAAALADGWQAVIFDRNGLHFSAFKAHPNAMLQILGDPADLAGWLDVLQAEVTRRFKFLAEVGAENWSLAPQPKPPRLLAVVDDFSVIGDMLDSPDRRALWLSARRLAADSRKSGIHLAITVQNPTWQSIDLGIRRNCTPLTFRVNDADASRAILNAPGAEVLGPRQFLTTVGNTLARGVAFAPGDDQIGAFLEARRVPEFPRPAWLCLPPPGPARQSLGADQADKIREMWRSGASLAQIQRDVFGYQGGSAYAAVKSALEGCTTAEIGAVPA